MAIVINSIIRKNLNGAVDRFDSDVYYVDITINCETSLEKPIMFSYFWRLV